MAERVPVAGRLRESAISFAASLFAAMDAAGGDAAESNARASAVLAAAASAGISSADCPCDTPDGALAARFWQAAEITADGGKPLVLDAVLAAAGEDAALLRRLLEPRAVTGTFAAYYAGAVAEARRAIRIANAAAAVRQSALATGAVPPEAWDAFARAREEADAIRILPAAAVMRATAPGGEEVLPGLVHRGDVAMLAAPSKAGKTWFLLGLAAALAAGAPFAGLHPPPRPMRVLYADGELEAWELRTRLAAMETLPADGLAFLLLRGRTVRPPAILPAILSASAAKPFDLVVFDPFYTFETGRDESSAADMACAMTELQKVAHDTRAAVLFAHHFSKGSKGSTAKADRASGSGVIVRAVNACITLSPHSAGEGYYLLEAVTRSFAAFAPRVLSFRWPHWQECPGMDANPSSLEGAETRRRADAPDPAAIAAEISARILGEKTIWTRKMVHQFARDRGADLAKSRAVCDALAANPSSGVAWDRTRHAFAAISEINKNKETEI